MSTLPYHPPSATNVSAVEGEKRQMVRGKMGLLASPCQGGRGRGSHQLSFPLQGGRRRAEQKLQDHSSPLCKAIYAMAKGQGCFHTLLARRLRFWVTFFHIPHLVQFSQAPLPLPSLGYLFLVLQIAARGMWSVPAQNSTSVFFFPCLSQFHNATASW